MLTKASISTFISTLISVGIFIVVIMGIISFFQKKTTWLGFYYPDTDNKSKYVLSKPFETLGQCSVWAGAITKGNDAGATECGKDCKFNDGLDIYVCKEVVN